MLPAPCDFIVASFNHKIKSKAPLLIKTIKIKAASSVERALAVHAPWGMLPSGLLHATPCDEEAVPL